MDTQSSHQFFFEKMVTLMTSRPFGEAFARLNSPPVLGELLAGIVLGPSLLGWLEAGPVIKLLAEIGIILLLFEVGLETDIRQLAKAGFQSLVVAVNGFIWPFVLGFLISARRFDLTLLESLFIGDTLTATSIGITMRVLTDLKRKHSREAQVVPGTAVIDGIPGVVLLTVLYEFSVSGGVGLANAGRVLLFILVFFTLAPLIIAIALTTLLPPLMLKSQYRYFGRPIV